MERVLIANRGEIAVRIAHAAAALGIETVAIAPPADATALHTTVATMTVALPAVGDPVAAYLDIDAVIQAGVDAGCDAVHPGYGFLSENAEFARRCAAAGMTFVGPSPEALELFGDKVQARALANKLDIPTVLGSPAAIAAPGDAAAAAESIGYPVMLKAAAGGGGRGMRAVMEPSELADAFERCQSEASAAFGDGSLFLERLVVDPRHIEVQVMADNTGAAVHFFERDCSVQLRNQKVIEIAPAANLDPDLRAQILADALTLISGASYHNAGTVEFLVEPATGDYFFIECNPRIQVEHTITEQVMGTDLVQTQFRVAMGESLASLGLGDQAAVGEPRGWSVQARVVATGAGTITGYREPSGPGVRVDGAGYAGWSPPPQFDPLLAKVIVTTNGGTHEAAIDHARRAVNRFHIGGLATNLGQLDAILAHSAVRAGDARTTLLANEPGLTAAAAVASPMIAMLESQAGQPASVSTPGPAAPTRSLPVDRGEQAVESPLVGTVIEVNVAVGDDVAVGDTLLVVTAMKMETLVTAPCSGVVMQLAAVGEGDPVTAGDMLAVIAPSADGAVAKTPSGENTWGPTLDDVATLEKLAHERLAPGSTDPGVVRQRNRNKLTCRERIDLLLDDGSFREIGSIAGFASYNEFGDIDAFTPANMVGGQGMIEQRPSIVCADDFTSRGGHSDGAIGAKSTYLDRLSIELQMPSIRLLDGSSGGGSVASMVPKQKESGDSSAKESSGAIKAGRPRVSGGGGSFLPGHLGSSMYARQLATVPVVNMLLGSVVGLGAAKAVLGHFSVMVRDTAQLFVAGPPVVSHAMGYDVTKEDLGDWRIHCRNGSVDNLAESEEEAVAMTRQFLSYLPSSVYEAPTVLSPSALNAVDRRDEELFTIVPRNRTTTFDIRRAISLLADKDSFFEIGALWGSDQVVGFARFNGYPVGIVASDSRHINGGALTADGCDKLTRHLDLCDLFHVPVLNLVDNPGFAVGIEHEINGTIRKGATWMVAAAQSTVPMFTVLMRRSFGVAGNNYATPRSNATMRVAWPAADAGGIPPEGGIEAAYKRQLAEADDPVALRAELNARIESARGPIGPLNRFELEEMIDPRDTRRLICEWLPTAYRLVNLPTNLGPRPLEYRP
ncbi:MAG: carboxyl transferase domain-containing protein [Acidimicrobiales bacterium]|jgi:acetyl/propionyl-CoA carboxylase alpha subunit/acetyl-CoA carboxylase carboxyltransferase component